jgi:hypothetical protein
MKPIEELYEKVAKNPSLQAEFTSMVKQGETDGPEAKMDRMLSFAKGLGYPVNAEEVTDFFEQLANQTERELSDAELDMVAGGKSAGGAFTIAISVFSAGVLCVMESMSRNNSDPQNGPPLECSQMFD